MGLKVKSTVLVVIILLNNFEPSWFEVHEVDVPYQGGPSREDIEELGKINRVSQ
jgi:hypothetical protein